MADPLTIDDPAALPSPDRQTDVEVNRTRLRVWEWGDRDAPAVIVAHGAHDHGRMWDQLAPSVASLGYRVLAPDSRGHGASGRLGSGHAWNASALDLACLARTVGHRVGLVGHSFGGGQVFSVAATMPELVAWAVNIDGIGPPVEAFDDPPLAEFAARCLDGIDRVTSRGARAYPTVDDLVERRAAVNTRLPRRWIEHLVRHGHAVTADGVVFATDPLFGVGVPDGFTVEHGLADLSAIEAPTLVITGSAPDTWSELSRAEIARRVAMLRDGRHVEVADAGHYVHIEQPSATFEAIAAFLDEIDAPSRQTVLEFGAEVGTRTSVGKRADGSVSTAGVSVGDLVDIDHVDDRIVVLHELGVAAGGRPWRDATRLWPGRLDAPDLPGHGGVPAPTGGHYEALDVPFMVSRLFPPVDGPLPLVVGVGTSGWAALVLGLGGRASAVVLVDGLGGPWLSPAATMRAVRQLRRQILLSPDATAAPRRPFDQRLFEPPHLLVGRADVEAAIAALEVPLLVVETPDSPTPLDEAVEVAGVRLLPTASAEPSEVLPAVTSWLHDRARFSATV